MPGTETVTTEQVAKLLDSLNESCPDNNFEQLTLSNVSAAMGTQVRQKSLVAGVCGTGADSAVHRPALQE